MGREKLDEFGDEWICNECDGNGKVDDEEIECPHCYGAGRNEEEDCDCYCIDCSGTGNNRGEGPKRDPQHPRTGSDKCRTCDGTTSLCKGSGDYTPKIDCEDCEGSGKLPIRFNYDPCAVCNKDKPHGNVTCAGCLKKTMVKILGNFAKDDSQPTLEV